MYLLQDVISAGLEDYVVGAPLYALNQISNIDTSSHCPGVSYDIGTARGACLPLDFPIRFKLVAAEGVVSRACCRNY